MPNAQRRYSIAELADLAGVTPRTVRFYLSQGLLPSPGTTGPGTKYSEEHLDRLRLIRRLQRQHLPLAEIRSRLDGLSDLRISMLADEVLLPDDVPASGDAPDTALDYVRRLLAPEPRASRSLLRRAATREAPAPAYASTPAPPPLAAAGPPVPPPEPGEPIERSQWERITLARDVELHVRRPLPRSLSRKVDRLVTIARELLEEDPS